MLYAHSRRPTRSFEMVSADVAAEMTERHRWAITRRYTVHRAIVLHMSPPISQAELPRRPNLLSEPTGLRQPPASLGLGSRSRQDL